MKKESGTSKARAYYLARLAAFLRSAPKTKKFPFYFLSAPPHTPPPKNELEGYFFVLVPPFRPPQGSIQ